MRRHMYDYLVTIPVVAVFGIIGWTMIFLETYMHFPEMDKKERIKMGAVNATVLVLILIAVVYLSMLVFLGG
jgi:heme/copper-type cytochrome/quinol oxidase subunit 4